MDRQELVFALSNTGYFGSKRSSNHHTITEAKAKNVQLSYLRCNQIYKGESYFVDPAQEEYYLMWKSKSLPSKSEMSKSQVTDAPSTGNKMHNFAQRLTQGKNLFPYNRDGRGNMAKSFNEGISSSPKILQLRKAENNIQRKYQFEEIKRIQVPNNFQMFKEESLKKYDDNQTKFQENQIEQLKTPVKKITRIITETKLNKSIHIDENQGEYSKYSLTQKKNNDDHITRKQGKSSNSEEYHNRLSNSLIHKRNPQRNTVKLSSPLVSPFDQISEKPEEQLNQIQILKKKLEEKEKMLQAKQKELSNTQKKCNLLENQLQKERSYANQFRTQLGNPTNKFYEGENYHQNKDYQETINNQNRNYHQPNLNYPQSNLSSYHSNANSYHSNANSGLSNVNSYHSNVNSGLSNVNYQANINPYSQNSQTNLNKQQSNIYQPPNINNQSSNVNYQKSINSQTNMNSYPSNPHQPQYSMISNPIHKSTINNQTNTNLSPTTNHNSFQTNMLNSTRQNQTNIKPQPQSNTNNTYNFPINHNIPLKSPNVPFTKNTQQQKYQPSNINSSYKIIHPSSSSQPNNYQEEKTKSIKKSNIIKLKSSVVLKDSQVQSGEKIKHQLGGTVQSLSYCALLMILLAKQMSKQ